jgi:hypothetical protein
MPRNKFTADELRRFALAKRRLQDSNKDLPDERRLSSDQIEKFVRESVKSGNVNEHGYIVLGEK